MSDVVLIDYDHGSGTITINKKRVTLSPSQSMCFNILWTNRNKIISNKEIFNYLYAGVLDHKRPNPSIIKVYMCYLRTAIQSIGGNPNCLECVFKRGFRLNVQEIFLSKS